MEIGSFFGSFDISSIIDKVYFFVGIFFLFAIIGGIIGTFLIVRSRNAKQKDMKKIGWWEEVSGTQRMEPTRMDDVEEIIIPGTTLRVFYCKKRDLWLPRFSRGISKDLFYVLLTPSQQMINFTLKSIGSDLKEANLDYDHTDMIWAAENAREYIKRNYKDKAVKWWQLYQGVITVAAYILIMTFCVVLIIFFLKGLVDKIGNLIGVAENVLSESCARTVTSGVTPAG